MRPTRLYLKNFMNHSESEIDCSLFRSVLIVGKTRANERVSNGVGKTTIFRAIEYALFNESFATTLDQVVRDGKNKAIVEFEFQMSGDKYKIYRHRTKTGSADVRLYIDNNGVWDPISEKTPTLTDQKIRSIIKISHKAFTYSVLFRQADLTGLSSVDDPKKRREILKEPINLTQYTKLEKIASEKTKPVKREIDQIEASITMLGNPDIDITKANADSELNEKEITDKKAEFDKVKNARDDIIDKINLLKGSLDETDASIHSKISVAENKIADLYKRIKRYDSIILTLSLDSQKAEKELSVIIKKIEDLSKKILDLESCEVQDPAVIKTALDKVRADEIKGSGLIAEIKAELRLIKRSLPDGDVCPSCQQSITKEYRCKVEADINEQIAKKTADLAAFEDAMVKCRAKKTKLENEHKTALDTVQALSSAKVSHTSSINEKSTIETRIKSIESSQEDNQKIRQECDVELSQATVELDTLKEMASKSNVANLNNQIFALQESVKAHEKSMDLVKVRLDTLHQLQGALAERVRSRSEDKTKLESLNNKLVEQKRKLAIQQIGIDAFKSIPGFIIQTVLDDLQHEVSFALKELRPDLEIQMDADLNFVFRRNGKEREYNQLSHGQHVYIALAFKRGMSRVIQKRLGIDIQFLELDEVDSALDEEGAAAFADSIRKWQKDFTVFVITHNKDLKDKFSHAIVVEEGDDGSEARLVSSW